MHFCVIFYGPASFLRFRSMLATQEAQVIPPIWMKHFECASLLLPWGVSLYTSLSRLVSFTGATLEEFERLRFGSGSSELVSVENRIDCR